MFQPTPNGFIYASNKDGGLGLPKLANAVSVAHLRAGLALVDSPNPWVRKVYELNRVNERLNKVGATGMELRVSPATRWATGGFLMIF